jgi:hypothetical protein
MMAAVGFDPRVEKGKMRVVERRGFVRAGFQTSEASETAAAGSMILTRLAGLRSTRASEP